MHVIPDDLREVLEKENELKKSWEKLTPLAQNEWICWLTIVKKEQTRHEHLQRLSTDIKAGKKRPCCWPGCPHRNQKAEKWFKN